MKRKIKAAIDAVDEIFGDTSVPLQTTLDALEEVQDNLQMKIAGVKSDINRAQRKGEDN